MNKHLVVLIIIGLSLFLNKFIPKYDYEYCDTEGVCKRIQVTRVIPSIKTINICNPDYIGSGAMNECEQVPINRLLLKGGTDKKYCNGHYNTNDFVDNYWNEEGLIDECEMPVNSDMQFIFKQHDQSIRSHNGTIQVKLNLITYDKDYKAMQVFTAEDHNNDNLPNEWKYCGNVDEINGKDTRIIHCTGNNLKFIKLVNAEWNKGSLFVDYVEVLKV